LMVLGSVDLQDEEGDRDGEDTIAERRSSGGLGKTDLILRGFLDGVLVRHDRMLAPGMRRYGSALSGHLPLEGRSAPPSPAHWRSPQGQGKAVLRSGSPENCSSEWTDAGGIEVQ